VAAEHGLLSGTSRHVGLRQDSTCFPKSPWAGLVGDDRDGRKAIENARKACQLSGGKEWSYLVTFAAAYAESGHFDKAKFWEAKAIEMATTDKSVTDKERAEARSRLELYKQGKPYREELKKK
jgi:hypothetical protein